VLVVRNIGGRAKWAMRDIVGIDVTVGLSDVLIVHHTGSLV